MFATAQCMPTQDYQPHDLENEKLPEGPHQAFPTSQGFGLLPLEVLLQICEHVNAAHRPSLYALALTSRLWHTTACYLIFRTVKVSAANRQQLLHSVRQCSSILNRTCGFKYVRCLVLRDASYGDSTAVGGRHRTSDPALLQTTMMPMDEDEDLITIHANDLGFRPQKEDENTICIEDAAWDGLARMIEHLSELADLVYGCSGYFPPRLLEAIHSHKSPCRLHITAFRFRSLGQACPDPYELALITSNCLHSIVVEAFDSLGVSTTKSFEDAVVLRVVSGLAPNLRKVRVCFRDDLSFRGHLRWALGPSNAGRVQVWSDFFVGRETNGKSVGALQELQMASTNTFDVLSHLQQWEKHTDFSQLRTLKLVCGSRIEVVDYLARHCNLASLERLILPLPLYGSRPWRPFDEQEQCIAEFLDSLPLLRALELFRAHAATALRGLEHHGPTLRSLHLHIPYNSCGQSNVSEFLKLARRIKELFPLLERCGLPMPYVRGRSRENEFYSQLGGMARLQDLTLDFCGRGQIRPQLEAYWRWTIVRWDEEPFALAIYRTLQKAKPQHSWPLERLRLRVWHGFASYEHHVQGYHISEYGKRSATPHEQLPIDRSTEYTMKSGINDEVSCTIRRGHVDWSPHLGMVLKGDS